MVIFLRKVTYSRIRLTRVNEFLDIKSEIVNKNFDQYEIKGDIEFRNVSYTYPNTGIKALENLSFKLEAGRP